jgi:hypothetical protein
MNGHQMQRRGLGLPDYRATDIAEKHIRRGLCLLMRHAPTVVLLCTSVSIAVSL